ncbi:hypothetical protein M501DRAFT_918928, partial [Patellaria atrata CBS 101060]
PAEKRISTPAGQRLSVILESSDAAPGTLKGPGRNSMRKSGLIVGDIPRESLEDNSNSNSSYSYSVWSDGYLKGDGLTGWKNNKHIVKRGGWKRLLIILLVFLALIIAVVVGVVVGVVKKKGGDNSTTSDSQSATEDPSSLDPSRSIPSPTRTPGSTNPLSSNFPKGSYSMVTFLDTVQTNCTSDSSTWTCPPYTTYNDNQQGAMATFNWIISSAADDSYEISSSQNPFSITFNKTPLKLLDQGRDSERYRFQVTMDKVVVPRTAITGDGASTKCFFNGTTFQGYLYTKMAKDYPTSSMFDDDDAYPAWPFAVRAEQVIANGADVPNCYKVENGELGDFVEINGTETTGLCSCLYKNWRTPDPY